MLDSKDSCQIYGSDSVGTEILTDAAWENLLQDPNPQVSGG